MELQPRTAIVVGASSGIGAAVAKRLARQNYRLALLARNKEALEITAKAINEKAGETRAHVFPHDVTDYEAIPTLFDEIVQTLGGLDLIVYASGIMQRPDEGQPEFPVSRQMVEVNLLGCMAWCDQAADFMGRVGHGCIVGIGSIAGDRGRKGNPGYNTSKGAQAIYLEALRNRLHPRGVRVVTIKPGYIDTPMTAGMGSLPMMISADAAARKICRVLRKGKGSYYVPGHWRLVSLIMIHIPGCLFRRIGPS